MSYSSTTRRRRLTQGAGILLAALVTWAILSAALPPAPVAGAPPGMAPLTQAEMTKMENAFVGVKGCKKCHMSQTGNQFKTWQAGPHAKAFETLKSDAAKKVAADMGLGDPSQEAACLKCHVTGYGMDPKLTEKIDMTDGVGCESCHGAGEKYTDKEIHHNRPEALKAGMVLPDEQVCVKCHNEESPSYKPFDFEKRSKEIEHYIPDEKRKHTKPRGK